VHGDSQVSLLWKGVQLERRFGSIKFGVMVAYLLVASHILVVALSFGAADVLSYPGLLSQCAVGFSAVLFGLKAVLNANSPTFSQVGGMLLPTKYAAWAELVRPRMRVAVSAVCNVTHPFSLGPHSTRGSQRVVHWALVWDPRGDHVVYAGPVCGQGTALSDSTRTATRWHTTTSFPWKWHHRLPE
jgi:hypothetical protein